MGIGIIAALVLALGACATPGPFLRSNAIPEGSTRVITTDAKLRNVYMVPPNAADGTDARWRVCAEASPDVFSALSASTAASIGGSQSPSATEANARLAHAVAEAAGTIERTQTINLLRESMYRTCERYLSGAISRPTFVVQAGRDWRAMIAILAIEQLTRTARPPSTIIVPPTTNAVITEPTEFAAELRRAASAAEDARIARDAANSAFTAAACPAPAQTASEAADVTAKRARCQQLDADKIAAANDVRRAEAAETALSNASARAPAAAPGANAATGGGTSLAGGNETARNASDLQAVATNVQAIVRMAFDTDEIELFCVQMLSGDFQRPGAADRNQLEQACINYALQRVNRAAGVSPQWAAGLRDDLGDLRTYLGPDSAVARTRWAQLLEDAGLAQTGAPALVNAVSVDEMITALNRAFEVDRAQIIAAMERRRRQ